MHAVAAALYPLSRLPARTSPLLHAPLSTPAVRARLQPAAELGHLQGHGHERHVPGALRACPDPQALSRAFPVHAACAAAAPRHALPPPGLHPWPPDVRAPLLTLGRAQTLCPPPTSCSSAARGRAPRPSPPLAMARAGLREAARERSSARELLRLIVTPSRATTTSISGLDSLVAAGKRDCLCSEFRVYLLLGDCLCCL
jgi:hypothetical protein